MENPERTDGNILCGLKTDLNLLLECLKYQMDSPVTQKQALITIYSICQQNSEASDYFREIGGLQFVNGLVKLSDASILREAALFTLGALAESSVYCQESLCTAELLSDVASSLAQKDTSLILKRMHVYVILVLVSHNKENQRLCIAALPFAKDCLQKCIRQEVIRPICAFIGLTVANNSYVQDYFCKVGGLDALAQALVRLVDESVRYHSSTELAVAVTKTLDSCISENSTVASRLSEYLIVPKLVALLSQNGLDMSSKLGIILAIGHCTDACEEHQHQLLQSNGLPLMIQIVAESQDEEQRKAATFVLQSCQLITKRLSNGLVENFQPGGDTVTSYGNDYPKDNSLRKYWKFAEEFLHRIETLEKQQEESCDSLLTGTDQMAKQKEDVPIKHYGEQHSLDKSCMDNTKMDKWTGGTRQAKIQDFTPVKRKLDFSHAVNGQREEDSVIPAINSSPRAEENRSQHRDQRLMEKVRRQIFVEDDVPQEVIRENTNAVQFGNVVINKLNSNAQARDANSQQHDVPSAPAGSVGPRESSDNQNKDRVPETDQQHGARFCFMECKKLTNRPVTVSEAGVTRPSASRKEQKSSDMQDFKKAYRILGFSFKIPAPVKRKRSKQNYIDPLILCSDLIDNEISSVITSPAPSLNASLDFRCSEILLTPIKKTASSITNFHRKQTDVIAWPKPSTEDVHVKSFLLTPVKKSASGATAFHRQRRDGTTPFKPTVGQGYEYQPDHRKDLCTPQVCNKTTIQDHIYSFDDDKHSDICEYSLGMKQKRKRRRRKDFTEKEVSYLLDGVKKMGYHWNSILWSYPFQKGRTNVDLAHKYRNLQVRKKLNFALNVEFEVLLMSCKHQLLLRHSSRHQQPSSTQDKWQFFLQEMSQQAHLIVGTPK
ncbi:telomere repeats-binding bouquet formation protein 1 [Heptranchias perlo]|uniref:telomere repeats-binding bouquet formation protein 1 n=1 Tax=Heptranchias perlo TaxID=212740 RepID=UPI003559F052